MADPRATEMLYGRADHPAYGRADHSAYGRADHPAAYGDSAPAPVMYTRYTNHGPATPNPYDAPPLPPYDPPYAPRHFLPPYEYEPGPPGPLPPREYGEYGPGHPGPLPPRGQEIPPNDSTRGVPTKTPPQREAFPYHDPPADMVIPGVQHPDGRFEPHPYFAKRSAPAPPVEPEQAEEPSKKTVEVAVPVCCEECRELITNYVGETPGVDAVDCDVSGQKLTVTGDLPPAQVLQRCRKCFKKSTLM